MGVPFKKIARKDPRKADAVAKFYPQLVTLGDNATLDDIAYVMKEKSSLTLGCKGVHRKEHQGGENQFPAFQHRKTGHRRHACRAED